MMAEGREVGDPVSARNRAKGSKPYSLLVSEEQSQLSVPHSQKQRLIAVDASNAEDTRVVVVVYNNYNVKLDGPIRITVTITV